MEKKICSRCHIEKNIDMFTMFTRKNKSGSIRVAKYYCKKCDIEIQRTRRNKEKEVDPQKYHKKWADYYAKTKDHNKIMKKEYLKNPENRKARNAYIRKYKASKRETDPQFKLYENHRKRIWKCLKNKTNSSADLLGCEIKNYVKWIEYTMDTEMNWSNYGLYWNIDHIIPIEKFDMNNPEDVKKAFNWKNTWAMVSTLNFSKNSHLIQHYIDKHHVLLEEYCNKNNIVIN